MRANSWLYHYYMVQSRLQYNLAYGGQPASIAAALYPQMMQHMMQSTGPTSPGGTPTGPPLPPGKYFIFNRFPKSASARFTQPLLHLVE